MIITVGRLIREIWSRYRWGVDPGAGRDGSPVGVSSLLALSLDCMITYPGWAYLRGVVEEDSVYQREGRGREDHVLREHWRWTRPGRLPDTPHRPRLSRAGYEESGRAGW